MIEAFKNMSKEIKNFETITEETVSNYLYTKDSPDPDIIVRTSGELRLSNFLTWQSTYSELYFIDKHWPDFKNSDLDLVVEEYSKRRRRNGV